MIPHDLRTEMHEARSGWRVPEPASSITTTEADLPAIEVVMAEHAADCQTFGTFPAQTTALLVRMVRHKLEQDRG